MTARDDEEQHRLREPVSEADWSRGPTDAPVTLVEYLDFECPHCQAAYPEIERMLRAQAGKVRLVVRHFPIVSSHARALAAALAAEAAGRQGKFWEMHAALFENPGRLGEADLRGHARALGLDLARFDADRADPELARKIKSQKRQGIRSGVNGTPTLYINGLRYDGPKDAGSLSRVVEAIAREGSEK